MNRRRFLSSALVPFVPAAASSEVFAGFDCASVSGVGLATNSDRYLLAIWLIAEETHRGAAALLEKYGPILKLRGSPPIQSPYLAIMNRQAEIMLRAARELGLSPLARQASHSHADRAALANALLERGHVVDGGFTKTFKKGIR